MAMVSSSGARAFLSLMKARYFSVSSWFLLLKYCRKPRLGIGLGLFSLLGFQL